MLTRDLLMYKARSGKVQPRFIDLQDDAWLRVATQLWNVAQESIGETRAALSAAFQACLTETPDPLIAKGIAKLVFDRLTFAEPGEGAMQQRAEVFARSTAVLRTLPQGATRQDYEQALSLQFDGELATLRDNLYADLPDSRPLLELRAWDPNVTLQRYNMAQVQGLLLYSHGLTVRTRSRDTVRIRRVLRWLKFCRLVADVQHTGDTWTMSVSGPAAIFSQQKKYGLQLAMFLPTVPLLDTFEIEATVELRRDKPWVLKLDQSAPLVSPYSRAVGYVPPELSAFGAAFADDAWTFLTDSPPRHVGTQDMCVPDFSFSHETGANVHVELFHRWHQSALLRRIEGLRHRPDTELRLGVDRGLTGNAAIDQAVNSSNNVFLFSGMPTQRKIREILSEALAASPPQVC